MATDAHEDGGDMAQMKNKSQLIIDGEEMRLQMKAISRDQDYPNNVNDHTKCKTCKWYKPTGSVMNDGDCTNEKVWKHIYVRFNTDVWFRPDFGCIFHSKNE